MRSLATLPRHDFDPYNLDLAGQTRRSEYFRGFLSIPASEPMVHFDLQRVTAVFVARGIHGKTFGGLVLNLDGLVGAILKVRADGKVQGLGDPLLHGQAGSGGALARAYIGIDSER